VLKADDFLLREMVAKGVVRAADIDRARAEATARSTTPIEALQSLSLASPRDIALVRALVCETPFIDLNHFALDLSQAALLDRSVAELHQVFPLFVMEAGVIVAAADPLNYRGLELVRQRLGREIEVVLCEPRALRRLSAGPRRARRCRRRPRSRPRDRDRSRRRHRERHPRAGHRVPRL
jgi:hypothetical protein